MRNMWKFAPYENFQLYGILTVPACRVKWLFNAAFGKMAGEAELTIVHLLFEVFPERQSLGLTTI